MSSGFISESDLAERRKVRNEIWQNNRTDSDPEEPPEEPVPDNRSLYEQLQQQKDKKQEEWEEAHKLKNMVRGLEDDEVDFLEFVDNTKLQEEKRIKAEDKTALIEYRKKVSAMQQKAFETDALSELKPELKKTAGSKKSSSTLSLLAGAIKRKRSDTDNDEDIKNARIKSSKTEEQQTSCETSPEENMKAGLQCVAVLPGLGNYTDTSDSDNDSNSDSEVETSSTITGPRDITGRLVTLHQSCQRKGCC